ncbi:MAG: hypothetical protein LUG99_03515 [Lachnospiraceae bacterium]|nr:hypothetical protein [Lachnospiraceae bacterium]
MTNEIKPNILSIDSKSRAIWGGEIIKLSVQLKKKEVEAFLGMLNSVLCSNDFDVDRDLVIIKSKKGKGKEIYSTPHTLLDLEYNAFDVAERLRELTIDEYSETLVDKDDGNPPLLFVFGKDINHRQIYIKLKIKGDQKKHILCVSFHYSEEKMSFPYKTG